METRREKFSNSITFKLITIGVLTLLLLIPGAMIQSLIRERQVRSEETVKKINEKWSLEQRINGPILVIPYKTSNKNSKNNLFTPHTFNITPEELNIQADILPEVRHYGIYKSILYKSKLIISGNFKPKKENIVRDFEWNEAYLKIGISDLRGIESDVVFKVNDKTIAAETGNTDSYTGQGLMVQLKDIKSLFDENKPIHFSAEIALKGSENMSFVPLGRTTDVSVKGKWESPSFVGNFTPEYELKANNFTAHWKVLHFNRNIPEYWIDDLETTPGDNYFGVNLIDTVNHYQLNMRSAKYALMFIGLTFIIFFFVELFTKKKIHFIQYLLVGVALILFYSLLLSISEQLNFDIAYFIASIATIGLIASYAHSIFNSKKHTSILIIILALLYTYLFVILQLEDIALLIGSIGLFIILGIIMFLTHKIDWFSKDDKTILSDTTNQVADNYSE